MTQEVLAARCGLSADTIRRLEHGSFSPSLDTLRKLSAGLDLLLSTLFEGYELGVSRKAAELIDLVSSRAEPHVKLATSMVRNLFAELDALEQTEQGAALEQLDRDDELDSDDE
jgi:transcriptional regulator with XRE-family HTH domain